MLIKKLDSEETICYQVNDEWMFAFWPFWTDAQYTLANSEDPDEMQHDATFHQDQHSLLR